MKKFFSRFLPALVFFLTQACIHTQSYEVKPIEGEKDSGRLTYDIADPQLKIGHIIYSADKFPLEDFFSQLLKGEFKDSIRRINLTYKPSNTKNDIVKELLQHGLVPVYVSVKNVTDQPVKISHSEFKLISGAETFRSVNPIGLPNQFKRFSPTAVAANIYNVTVVTAVVVVFVLVLAGLTNGSGLNFNGIGDSPARGGSPDGDGEVINKTETVTKIDYKNYVIDERVLQPGEETGGLLFFNLGKAADAASPRLIYSP